MVKPKKKMIVVLTASHLDCPERKNLLRKAIASVLSLGVNRHLISISANADIVIGELSSDPRVEVTVAEKRLRQFEHLERLKDKVHDEDKVIMLDDDDLLLAVPAGRIVRGNQWMTKGMTSELAHIDHTFSRFSETCETVADFSGYTMPGKIFKQYFETRSKISGYDNLEDCRFTNFIDAQGAVKAPFPFVFRRLWANPRSWKNG